MGGLATGPPLPPNSRSSYSRTAMVSPSWTVRPTSTRISFTTPARGASTGISIFIDSSTITGSPASTESPGWATTWKTTPVMWALMSSGIERSLLDHLGMHDASPDVGMRHDAAEKRDRGLDALDDARAQGSVHSLDRLGARRAPRDELQQQRVVMHGHDASSGDPTLHPDPLALGQHQRRDRPRRR